jgi:2-polyprenyl-3-methyl-5-hydroxy-6-metoxy-1,4-benzoquinol methylase
MKCCNCGMTFTNPQSPSYASRVKKRGVLDRFFDPSRLENAKRLASLHLSYLAVAVSGQGRRVLDFGCGEGAFVRQAQDEGWDAIGVDLNEALIAAARDYWRSDVLHSMSLEQLAGNGWQFDAIYSYQVFEHLPRPVEAGLALTSLLVPGGLIYIDVPNANHVKELLKRGTTLDPTSHFNHFTVSTLSRLMARIGCAPVFLSAAPGMFRLWRRLGMNEWALPLARVSRRILPGIGAGACVVGQKI